MTDNVQILAYLSWMSAALLWLAVSPHAQQAASNEMCFSQEVADKIRFMSDGCIVESGSPDRVILHLKHERTRAFLTRFRRANLKLANTVQAT